MHVDGRGYEPTASSGLWILDPTTGNNQRILADCRIGSFAVSPDGSQVAYAYPGDVRKSYRDSGVFVARADGSGEPQRLTTPDEGSEQRVEWLPSGEGLIVYRDMNPDCVGDCFNTRSVLVSLTGEPLPFDKGEEVELVTPDGLVVDDGSIWFRPYDGDTRLISEGSGGERFFHMSISPDGKWLAFVKYDCGECEYP